VNPTSCGTKFIVVNCIFLPIAFISIVIRVWTRMFITREFRLRRDDGEYPLPKMDSRF
jgi:hypothetical protein